MSTNIPSKNEKTREYVYHTFGPKNICISEEYYEFIPNRGWILVSEEVGEKWSNQDVNYKTISHSEVMPKRRRNGSIGREKMFLAYDADKDRPEISINEIL